MSSGGNVVTFPSNRQRDQAIIDYFERRLAHERRARSGLMSDVEIVEQIMVLNAEMFSIAKKFNL